MPPPQKTKKTGERDARGIQESENSSEDGEKGKNHWIYIVGIPCVVALMALGHGNYV